MKRLLLAVAVAAASLAPAAAHAAYPDTTLCDNEPWDTWVPLGDDRKGVGVDQTNGDYYVCLRTGLTGDQYQLVVLRPSGGKTTICTAYSNDGVANDSCLIV